MITDVEDNRDGRAKFSSSASATIPYSFNSRCIIFYLFMQTPWRVDQDKTAYKGDNVNFSALFYCFQKSFISIFYFNVFEW